MLIVRCYNNDCRARLETSPKGEVFFSMETRIDEDAPFNDNGRRVSIGSVSRNRSSTLAEFADIDCRTQASPILFVRKHCRNEEHALVWLASQVNLETLPTRFKRAIEITRA
jgi:hypothetical protein